MKGWGGALPAVGRCAHPTTTKKLSMCPSYWRVAPRRTFTTASKPLEHGVAALKGKRALVTGSTQGLGLGIAQALLSSGCTVMLNGVASEEQVQSVTTQLRSSFPSGRFFIKATDLSSAPQVEDLVNTTTEELGGIDILVNNAGIQHVAPLESFPVERWDTILSVNLSAVFHTMRLAVPHMKQNKWGRIINISSVHGLVASVNKSAYVASKHGVVGLTKVVALETAGTGVTCNCINPGWILTDMVKSQVHALAQKENLSFEEAATKLLQEKQPSKQFVTISQISDTVLFLCGDNASQITGITLPVDGGWTSQ